MIGRYWNLLMLIRWSVTMFILVVFYENAVAQIIMMLIVSILW